MLYGSRANLLDDVREHIHREAMSALDKTAQMRRTFVAVGIGLLVCACDQLPQNDAATERRLKKAENDLTPLGVHSIRATVRMTGVGLRRFCST